MPPALTVLLVEDNEDDVMQLERILRRHPESPTLKAVKTGVDAQQYLEGSGPFQDPGQFPLPNLVLLDLTLPGIGGFEVLKWIRLQPRLATLPVIVLTGSDSIRDVNQSYKLGANSFLVKPVDEEDLIYILKFFANPNAKELETETSEEISYRA